MQDVLTDNNYFIIELNYLGATGNGGIYVGDADGTSTSGSLLWDSTNDNGQKVATGLYFYYLSTKSNILKNKMTLVK